MSRRSSAAIAIGAISTALTVRHTRAGGHYIKRGSVTRRAVVAGKTCGAVALVPGKAKKSDASLFTPALVFLIWQIRNAGSVHPFVAHFL